MNCWSCKAELIWGGDHDMEEENDDYDMVTNLSCPKCHCLVDVYHPSAKLLQDVKDHEKIKSVSREYIKERDRKKK